jgi:signal transduction histidine kinase
LGIRLKANWLTFISLLWVVLILAMTAWWAYLLYINSGPEKAIAPEKLLTIIKWEGGTLIVLLIFLSMGLLSLYFLDNRRTKELQTFFSTLTHELKTPLASIRLQSEVLQETLDTDPENQEAQKKLVEKILSDTLKMENRMDKILQFNRLGKINDLNLENIELFPFIRALAKKWALELNINWDSHEHPSILADHFALELIFKNLFENTKNHAESNKVQVDLETSGNWVFVYYRDQNKFDGDVKKLGNLFYKHNSNKGTGIGLHLIKNLMNGMNGDIQFLLEEKRLVQRLNFPRGQV